MNGKHNYDTVSEATNDLYRRGYTSSFSVVHERERLVCENTSKELAPEEFEIDEIYRFEGMTDPADEMIVFAISSEKHHIKGVLVNAFGIYSDGDTNGIVKRLSQHI